MELSQTAVQLFDPSSICPHQIYLLMLPSNTLSIPNPKCSWSWDTEAKSKEKKVFVLPVPQGGDPRQPDLKNDISQHLNRIKPWEHFDLDKKQHIRVNLKGNIPLISIRHYLELQKNLPFLAPQLQESWSILLKALQRFVFALWTQGSFKWKCKGSWSPTK